MSRAVAVARSNIALVKYWGTREASLNLPAVGSLSLTLDGLETRTEVRWDDEAHDRFILNGAAMTGTPLARVSAVLDLVRARAGHACRARVESANNFPSAAGLASSASGFAALALAASRAAGLRLGELELSALARRGSGSAARSIYGGFVVMDRGVRNDGVDAVARPLETNLDVRMVVAVCGEGIKSTLSTDGMRHTAETSAYYQSWVTSHPQDLEMARQAVEQGDLQVLGTVMEHSCLKMHAAALAARPGILYWSGATVDGFHLVRALRGNGTDVWFTNDAGPHVKALCRPEDAERVSQALSRVAGVTRVLVCRPGMGAELIEG